MTLSIYPTNCRPNRGTPTREFVKDSKLGRPSKAQAESSKAGKERGGEKGFHLSNE